MTRFSWHGIFLTASSVILLVAASGFADSQDQGKGKGKGPKADQGSGGTVQIDLSKLPPDLAKQLMKYVGKGEKAKGPKMEGKGPKTEAKAYGTKKLPPGLANKPADHPGRVAWLKAHGSPQPAAPQKKGKGKSESE